MIIEITEPAQKNFEDIKKFIKEDSVYYANIFVDRIFIAMENLINQPRIGRIVPEYNIENIREIIYENYRIVYQIIDSSKMIYILTVIHGSRMLKRHLEKKDTKK